MMNIKNNEKKYDKFLLTLSLLASKYYSLKRASKSLEPLIKQLIDFASLEEIKPKIDDKFSPFLHESKNNSSKGKVKNILRNGYKIINGEVILKAVVENR